MRTTPAKPLVSVVVHTLGACRIEAGPILIRPVAAKRFALLLYLVVERPRRISRFALQELLFPRLTDSNGRHALRELLYEMRHLGLPIDCNEDGVALSENTDVRIDAELLIAASRITEAQAAEVAKGFLPEYNPTASETLAGWVERYRAETTRRLLTVLFAELSRATSAGSWRMAEAIARSCLALDPLDERATLARAECRALSGDRPGALRLLDEYLADLGIGPGVATPATALRRRIASLPPAPVRDRLPFVGRDAEMTAVTTALEDSQLSGVRTVLLLGDPGIGKSRILDESTVRVELEGGTVLRVNAHPHDLQRPMSIFVDLVPLLLKQRGALGCSPESMTWLRRLGGEPTPQAEQDTRSSEETAYAIARALLDVISAIAAETRLVIVVDDAHWVDTASLMLLRDLSRGRRPTGLTLLLAARDQERLGALGGWGEHFVATRVGPLGVPVASALLAGALGSIGTEDPTLVSWMTEAAAGSPFYLDCLLAHYRTTGERFTVPLQLSTLIDQRVNGLSANALSVLEAIVGLGRYATLVRLEAILAIEGAAIVRAARELETGRFVVMTEGNTGGLRPFHWLIAESVHRQATPLAQALLYRRIAARLEQELTPDADAGLLWACSEAWVVGGEPAHAASLLVTCAGRALEIGRATEAAELYLRAGGLLPQPQQDELIETGIRIATRVREPNIVLRGIELLSRSPTLDYPDEIKLAHLAAHVALDDEFGADFDALEKLVLKPSAEVRIRIEAARLLTAVALHHAQPLRALGLRDTIADLLRVDDSTASPALRVSCALVYESMYGDVSRIPRLSEHLVAIGHDLRADLAVDAFFRAAIALYRGGALSESLALLEKAHRLAAGVGLRGATISVGTMLASLWLDAEAPDKTADWLQRTQAVAGDEQTPFRNFSTAAITTELALFVGDLETARLRALKSQELRNAGAGLRPRRWKTALGILGRHLSREKMDPSEIEHGLTKHHLNDLESGEPGDFEVAVLAMIHRDNGDEALARTQIQRYFEVSRRPGTPLTPFIRRVAASVGLNDVLLSAALSRKRSADGAPFSLRLPENWPDCGGVDASASKRGALAV